MFFTVIITQESKHKQLSTFNHYIS